MNTTDLHAKLTVVNGLRRAFERFKHHAKFTKRVLPIIEAELPEYTIHVDGDGPTILVWGKGIRYENAVHVTCPRIDGPDQSWQARMAWDLDRQDPSDALERAEQESALIPALTELAEEVRARIEEAKKMIEDLPVPASAKVRADGYFWEQPSTDLAQRFPELFK